VDYERQAGAYARARALSPDAAGAWREAVERWLAPLSPECVLDLGSGTGRFSPLLAEWLGCRVIGVEPSEGMRESAMRESTHPDVAYIAGNAHAIPLGDGSCDAAWLAYMVHHVPNRAACARELVRVLRPGGRVLVIGAYTERRRGITLFRFFPEGLRIVEQFPLVEEIGRQFEGGGLAHEATTEVRYQVAPGLRWIAERTRERADSVLQLLSDEEFSRGQAAIEAAAAAETEPIPIMDAIDLIVFKRD
jgi:ubiquinone/menaquinone biosynthesis C-methylase UbiE